LFGDPVGHLHGGAALEDRAVDVVHHLESLHGAVERVLRLDAIGHVADESGEDRRAGQVEAGDGEFDGELVPVRAHGGELGSRVQDDALAGREVVAKAGEMLFAERRRNQRVGDRPHDGLDPDGSRTSPRRLG